jgi:hypothetical protein
MLPRPVKGIALLFFLLVYCYVWSSIKSVENATEGLRVIYVFVGPPLWSSDQSSWLQNGDVLCFL